MILLFLSLCLHLTLVIFFFRLIFYLCVCERNREKGKSKYTSVYVHAQRLEEGIISLGAELTGFCLSPTLLLQC